MQCELCGSIDIVTTGDNLFQCQYCGCKYTLEQAKTLVLGTVTAKQSDFTVRAGKLEKYTGEATEIVIPDSVKEICPGVFKDCVWLTKVVIPDSVVSIEKSAFEGCTTLADIVFGSHIQTIGDSAFENCVSLKNVVLPNDLKQIGCKSFCGCSALEKITFSRCISFGKYPFFDCPASEEWKTDDSKCKCCGGMVKDIQVGWFSYERRCNRCGWYD